MGKQSEESFSILTEDAKDFFNPNIQGETFDKNTLLDLSKENITNESKKDNVSFIMDAFKEFYDKHVKDQEFDVKALMNFMEPKFAEAGYRQGFATHPEVRKKVGGGNVLILTDLGVGDFIVSTGAIREIRRIYSESHITLLVHNKTVNFAEICPHVNEVILDKNFSGKLPEMYELCMKTARRLLTRRFDVCFSFSTHAYTDLLMYMSGGKTRLTFIYQKHWLNINAVKKIDLLNYSKLLATNIVPYGDTHCHMADRYFSLVEEILHVPILNRKLEAWCTTKDLAIAKETLKNVSNPLYALCMGGTWARKLYPPEKYARLLEMIAAEEPSAHFVILGGGDKDLQSAEIIKKTVPELYAKRITNLVNKLTYRQTAAALSFCKMLIGNDTGTSHVAAGLGCPVLSPNCFSADFKMREVDAPVRWAPYGVASVIVMSEHALPECKGEPHEGYGCRLKTRTHCIAQIEPETLFKGFHLLKERVAKKITEPLYIS